MENLNIPIHRAKKIDSDEWVVGYFEKRRKWETKCISCGSFDTKSYNEYYSEECKCNNCGKDLGFHDDNWEHGYIGEDEYIIRENGEVSEIDPTTLSIHFPDMKDSEDNPIFASLSEDGRGGDILGSIYCSNDIEWKPYYDTYYMRIRDLPKDNTFSPNLKEVKVIGIQK